MFTQQPHPALRAELPGLESALLWCMRAWVIGHCRQADVSGRIRRVLAQLGVPDAFGPLDGFMGALGRGARRTIEIDCVCHPEVSADERALLHVLALQQEEEHDEAHAILARLLTEADAATACDCAQRLALVLSAAGETLRWPSSAWWEEFAAAGRPHRLH